MPPLAPYAGGNGFLAFIAVLLLGLYLFLPASRMNVEGLTNRQLLVRAGVAGRKRLVAEVRGGLVSDELELAQAALGEVVQEQKARELGEAEAEQEGLTFPARTESAFLFRRHRMSDAAPSGEFSG